MIRMNRQMTRWNYVGPGLHSIRAKSSMWSNINCLRLVSFIRNIYLLLLLLLMLHCIELNVTNCKTNYKSRQNILDYYLRVDFGQYVTFNPDQISIRTDFIKIWPTNFSQMSLNFNKIIKLLQILLISNKIQLDFNKIMGNLWNFNEINVR